MMAYALKCREEKGYGADEVELKIVDLRIGENFAPPYLRINPNGTVPTLVVPLERSLGAGIPVKYRALTDTKSVLEFLDKSRSIISRTHTTSSAPAPGLAPATVAFSDLSNAIITLVHSEPVDFLSVAATSTEELTVKSHGPLADYVRKRQETLQNHIDKDSESVGEFAKKLWQEKYVENGFVGRVYGDADKPVSELNAHAKEERRAFFKKSVEAWTRIKKILKQLEIDMVSPYTLGDQISLTDLHVGAWLTHVFFVCGARSPQPQTTPRPGVPPLSPPCTLAEDVIRGHTSDESFTLGRKVRAFWDQFTERESWKKVYAEGLH